MHTPIRLNIRWARAARLAFTLVPREAICAVMVVPMLSPRIRGSAWGKVSTPLKASIWATAIVALEDCTTMVMIVPTRTPVSGLPARRTTTAWACALWRRGPKASFISERPKNSSPNPRMTEPQCFHWRLPATLISSPTPMAGRA